MEIHLPSLEISQRISRNVPKILKPLPTQNVAPSPAKSNQGSPKPKPVAADQISSEERETHALATKTQLPPIEINQTENSQPPTKEKRPSENEPSPRRNRTLNTTTTITILMTTNALTRIPTPSSQNKTQSPIPIHLASSPAQTRNISLLHGVYPCIRAQIDHRDITTQSEAINIGPEEGGSPVQRTTNVHHVDGNWKMGKWSLLGRKIV